MRHLLLASTCCFCFAVSAQAETTIATSTTTPVRTSTIKQGAADDIKITSAGTIDLTASGAAVTVDSANKVTNEGTIKTTNADNSFGIRALAGMAGGIVNTGTINLTETYTPTDTDNDGDLEGVFALGTGRFGIVTAGAYSGDIVQNGTITVRGNDSGGVQLGGTLTGNFSHDGAISVIGDRAIGIDAKAVTGSFRLAGTVGATGVDAVGARFGGDIGGTLTIQGTVAATGFRYTTAPASASALDADDLLIGGSAVLVQGNVAGGIILAVPPKDNSTTDNDEDKDGIDDSKEGTAAVRSFGPAPAMKIGAADRDLVIGAVPGTGTGYGLIVDGSIIGAGTYTGFAGRGLQVGGTGGNVQIAGGIAISGSVAATSLNVSATAINIGAGASVTRIQNAGTIAANGSNVANTAATAIEISAGASLPIISNSGKITATATGADGTAIAIRDASGTLTTIENSGTISATGAGADTGRNIAIDLTGAATGVTVKQTVVASGFAAPAITGNVHLGAGNDLFDIADGTVTGNSYFGAGDDTLKLSGDAIYKGNVLFGTGTATMSLAGTSQFQGAVDFGGGAGTLSIGTGSTLIGSFANSGNLAVTIAGGGMRVTQPSQIASLAVTDKGTLGVTLGEAGNVVPLLSVTGTASFAAESKVAVQITDVDKAIGNHLLLRAGTLTGASNISAETLLVPWLYKASLSSNATDLIVAVARKSDDELGLNGSEAIAFDPVYAALSADDDMAATFLSITDQANFSGALRQMLPDHAGGTFAAVTTGSRALARMLEDEKGPFKDEGNWGYWISQQYWGLSKDIDDTAGYDVSGWAFGGGAEMKTGLGNIGLSVAYLWSKNDDKGSTNHVTANQYEIAGYWRLRTGGLRVNTRGSMAFIDLSKVRSFTGVGEEGVFTRTANASNSARLYSGSGSIGYEFGTGWMVFRPVISVDYYRLNERGYTETGGGNGFNLAVASRKSDELAVNASGVIGVNWGGEDQYAGWSRIEIEGGRREIVSGALGATVAHFSGGQEFTLLPEQRESGFFGRLRGMAGNSGFRVGGEVGAEQQQGNLALSIRASLRIGI